MVQMLRTWMHGMLSEEKVFVWKTGNFWEDKILQQRREKLKFTTIPGMVWGSVDVEDAINAVVIESIMCL